MPAKSGFMAAIKEVAETRSAIPLPSTIGRRASLWLIQPMKPMVFQRPLSHRRQSIPWIA